jgi:hypothetical protein
VTAPWMAPLSEGSRTAIKELVDASPPLTDTHREKLRLLFRAPISPPAKNESTPKWRTPGEAQLEGGAP